MVGKVLIQQTVNSQGPSIEFKTSNHVSMHARMFVLVSSRLKWLLLKFSQGARKNK